MRTVTRTGEPDALGFFGAFGGRYVPETVMGALEELTAAFTLLRDDGPFNARLDELLRTYVGRPTALTFAANLSEAYGARIYLKREDLAHTGAHKINNAIAQALLAKAMGKERLLAETGAGQHGVATATAGALLKLPVTVFMGTTDMARQQVNVQRMRMLGATVEGVSEGAGTLKEATSEAIRHWVRDVNETHYVIGSAVGPHPYPLLVKTFQSVIGREARAQLLERAGRLPDAVIACVGGGSNAIGIFSAFIPDDAVRLFGAEAGGIGTGTGQHAATLASGTTGVLHGAYSGLLADGEGRILPTTSISAGLDYPGVGPEHAHLARTDRAEYRPVTDADAMDALQALTRSEGILPALESAHAVALAKQVAREADHGDPLLLVNVSGRGDKDLTTILARLANKGGAR